MKPTFLGFTTQPYAIVVWNFKQNQSKTICYSEADLQDALARYHTPGDLYFQVPHNVHYYHKQTIPA